MPFKLFLFLLLPMIFTSVGFSHEKVEKSGWIRIFNGQNLDGFTIKIRGSKLNENYKNTFSVEKGILKISYDQYDVFDNRFGHIFYNKKLSNYILRLDYRFTGEQVTGSPETSFRNSGIMFHSQSAENMVLNQKFPYSVEVQLLGGAESGIRPTGNVCTPGTRVIFNNKIDKRICIPSNSRTFRGNQWVTAEIIVRKNGLITHKINNEIVLEYSNPQINADEDVIPPEVRLTTGISLDDGYIALQAEGHPVEFRNIMIKMLD